MDISKVIVQLEAAKEPTRFLDSQIAQAIGWSKVYGDLREDGKPNILWFPPNSSTPGKFPAFTASLQDAYELCLQIDPHHVAAISWGNDEHVSRFEDETTVSGPTPAISLCIAALKHRRRMKPGSR